MSDTIELRSPLDMHVHVRQGAMLGQVAPLTSGTFSGALVMPNTSPPITCLNDLLEYKRLIQEVVQNPWATGSAVFEPYMTLYLQFGMDRKFLESVKPHVTSIKLYPKGMTTNSEHGIDPEDSQMVRILHDMEELGIPLSVHGEARGYVMDRESLFIRTYLRWAEQFPNLKIIMEHITTKDAVLALNKAANLYCTVTAHHLLITTDDVLGDLLDPHLFCKPVAKRPEDREFLLGLVTGELNGISRKAMLGTDSAPHSVDKKECACGCAGVFTAPIALQLIAEEFYKRNKLEYFQRFVSDNARAIYGISPPEKTVVLGRTPFVIPARYGNVVPMWAGREIPWSLQRVKV